MQTTVEIQDRASNKAFAKILSLEAKQIHLKKDLANGRYGGVTKEEIQLQISCNDIELKVWDYIANLVEKNNKNIDYRAEFNNQ